jgi:siroheme synthase
VLTAGHRAPENADAEWKTCAASSSTLVVYMPGHDYAGVANRLSKAGFTQGTPCAIVSRATTPEQRVHRTTIADLPLSPKLTAPSLLIVGDVVKFAEEDAHEPTALVHKIESATEALKEYSAL